MDNHYITVEHPDSDFYALHLTDKSPFEGVRFIYGTVSIKEDAQLGMATLSFTYNIIYIGLILPLFQYSIFNLMAEKDKRAF